MRELPPPEALRGLLLYDPESGKLFWKERPRRMFNSNRACSTWNARFSGKEAFTTKTKGYLNGRVNGLGVQAHRVAWAIYFKEHPTKLIDHINGNKSDNRISNLRSATKSINAKNTKLNTNNTSGVPGVWWSTKRKRWLAELKTNYVKIHLGAFETFDEAAAARLKANPIYGFHENHGRTAGVIA